jgi:hypothetical protein
LQFSNVTTNLGTVETVAILNFDYLFFGGSLINIPTLPDSSYRDIQLQLRPP